MNESFNNNQFNNSKIDSRILGGSENLKQGLTFKESIESLPKLVQIAKDVKSKVSKVKLVREKFAKFLSDRGIDLYTSLSDILNNKSFIKSSYVVYRVNNIKEPLSLFLSKNTALTPIVDEIENLYNYQDKLN